MQLYWNLGFTMQSMMLVRIKHYVKSRYSWDSLVSKLDFSNVNSKFNVKFKDIKSKYQCGYEKINQFLDFLRCHWPSFGLQGFELWNRSWCRDFGRSRHVHEHRHSIHPLGICHVWNRSHSVHLHRCSLLHGWSWNTHRLGRWVIKELRLLFMY